MIKLAPRTEDHVRWHDLECGGYAADTPLWRVLAAESAAARPHARILDLGCGTGRVALDLAAAGHDVLGVDVDPVLCSALRRRAAKERLPVAVAVSDACALRLGERFGLILVPMQTVQLLDGATGRAALLTGIREHLAPGAVAAIALVEDVEPFGEEEARQVTPDMRDHDGAVYASRPLGVAVDDQRIVLDRMREIVDRGGVRAVQTDRTILHVVSADRLEGEARRAGLRVLPRRAIAPTGEHVGSQVVVLGGA